MTKTVQPRPPLAQHWRGEGAPILFQHGLGGDHQQTFEAFPEIPGCQLLTLECRGHGASQAAGPFSIAQFAADVVGAMPAGAVLGGISMGAAIATRIAVRAKTPPRALVLVRPAWTVGAAPPNLACIAEVAALIGAGQGLAAFQRTLTYARLRGVAPDNLVSLCGFFDRPDPAMTARLLAAIAADGPGICSADLAALRVPTLIVGCAEDAIHPLSHARDLATMIPGARCVEVPPKGRGKPAHLAALHAEIATFLKEI